jgi:hypothetical protein
LRPARRSLGAGGSKKRNSAAAEKRGQAKIPFPPTPFLFARPSENYQKSASGFSLKKVRISFRTDSIDLSAFCSKAPEVSFLIKCFFGAFFFFPGLICLPV